MSKTFTCLLFTFILTIVTLTPAILSIVDTNNDISILLDIGEEEETKESLDSLEIKVLQNNKVSDILFFNNQNQSVLNPYTNTYNSVYKQIFSPPPKQVC